MGTCDRSQGVCSCPSGYTGSACQRLSCPNECSGQGSCVTLSQVGETRAVPSRDCFGNGRNVDKGRDKRQRDFVGKSFVRNSSVEGFCTANRPLCMAMLETMVCLSLETHEQSVRRYVYRPSSTNSHSE